MGLPDPDTESDPQVFIQAFLKLDGVSLVGFADLKEQDQLTIAKHVSNKACWAKRAQKKRKETERNPTSVPQGDVKPAAVDATTTALVATAAPNQIVQKKKRFLVPVPGVDGALPNSLQGQTIVLTGIFPEVGGGAGLDMGKDKVKAMCQSFGARVTGAVSGKTTLLLVGKEPGMSKVKKAQTRKIPTADIHSIRNMLMDQVALEEVPPANISSFSAGYQRADRLALQNSSEAEAASKKRPVTIEAARSGAKPSVKKAKKATKKKAPALADGKENSNPSAVNKNSADIATTKDYSKLTCKELRAILKDRGLKVSGKKAVLIERLQQQKQQRQQPVQVPIQPVPKNLPRGLVPKHLPLQQKQSQQVSSQPSIQQPQLFRNPSEQMMQYQLAILQNHQAMRWATCNQAVRPSLEPQLRHPSQPVMSGAHLEAIHPPPFGFEGTYYAHHCRRSNNDEPSPPKPQEFGAANGAATTNFILQHPQLFYHT